MDNQKNRHIDKSWVRYINPVCSALVILIAFLTLVKWMGGGFIMEVSNPSFVPMAPSSALIFILLGVCLIIPDIHLARISNKILIRLITILVAIFTLYILLQFIENFMMHSTSDIEHFFTKARIVPNRYIAGRQSPITGILFVLCSFILFSGTFKTSVLWDKILHGSAIIVFYSSIILILGYVFGAPLLYGGTLIPVASPTALSFLLLSTGFLFQNSHRLFYRFTFDNGVFARLLRPLIPSIMMMFIVTGWITFQFRDLMSKPAQALAFASAAIISSLLLATLVIYIARYLQVSITKAEQKLVDINVELQALYDLAPVMMCILNEKKEVIGGNKLFQSVTGWVNHKEQNQTAPGNLLGCFHALDNPLGCGFGNHCHHCLLRKAINETFETKKGIWDLAFDTTIINDSSRVVNFIISTAPVQTTDSLRVILCFVDVTILKERETQLMALNASQNKFLSIISHDLRSPFNAILGYTELLTKEFMQNTNEENLVLLQRLNGSANRTFLLLENLLEWSQLHSGHMNILPVPLCLSDFVDPSIQLALPVAEQKQITIMNLTEPGIRVMADLNAISTVMRNLLSNAIKFSNSHSTITIQSNITGKDCRLSVIDHGIGMAPETIAKLFRQDSDVKRVGTNNEKGTGLGLLLAFELIRKIGGNLWVESALGKGSIFHFTIPLT